MVKSRDNSMDSDHPNPVANKAALDPLNEQFGFGLTIDISNWDLDEETGKIMDTRTGLPLLVDGEPNPEIARRLHISDDT